MHLRELVELLGKPTGWTQEQHLKGLDPYVILEWAREGEAITCVMTQASETAIALERAGEDFSQRWIAEAAESVLEPQLSPAARAESAWAVIQPWINLS